MYVNVNEILLRFDIQRTFFLVPNPFKQKMLRQIIDGQTDAYYIDISFVA